MADMTRDEIIKAADEVILFLEARANLWPENSGGEKHFKDYADTIRSIIALVPKEGEVVVPEEPIGKMIKAGNAAWPKRVIALGNGTFVEGNGLGANVENIYKAMLKAAKEEK